MEGALVERTAAHVAHPREHPRRPVGRMGLQPLPEQVGDFQRQAQQRVAGAARPRLPGGFQHRLHLMVVQRRDDWREIDRDRHARIPQPRHRFEPPRGRGGARLHAAREAPVERGDRDGDMGEVLARHVRQQVPVAQHQGGLGGDRDRMAAAGQHFQDAAHHAIAPLDGLVGVGVGADGEHPAAVARPRQFLLQQFGRGRLGIEAALEIEPRREPEPGMGRPRIAVDAAVLAAPVGIDRPVEAEVRGVVAGDDLARRLLGDGRAQRRRRLVRRSPAVVERFRTLALVAPRPVARRAPPFLFLNRLHAGTISREKNKSRSI